MKKRIVLFICFLITCILLVGCGNEISEPITPETIDESGNTTIGQSDLKFPDMKYWDLYNPNGFDTFTAIVYNPNNVDIDISYDLVFLKDEVMVSKIEGCYNGSVSPNSEDIIWINYNVPSADKVDSVKMENVVINESLYTPIPCKYEFEGIIDNKICYNYSFEKPLSSGLVNFLLYNDNNGNNMCDDGEIVVVEQSSILGQTGTVSYDLDVFYATNHIFMIKGY